MHKKAIFSLQNVGGEEIKILLPEAFRGVFAENNTELI